MSDIRLLKQALEDHDDEDEDEDEWCSAKEDMDNEEQFPESTSSSLLDLGLCIGSKVCMLIFLYVFLRSSRLFETFRYNLIASFCC